MPKILAYHKITKGYEHWRDSPRRNAFFGPLGVTNIKTFVNPQDPTQVGLIMDVADMGALQAAMQTEGAADAMAYDGVVPESLVIMIES